MPTTIHSLMGAWTRPHSQDFAAGKHVYTLNLLRYHSIYNEVKMFIYISFKWNFSKFLIKIVLLSVCLIFKGLSVQILTRHHPPRPCSDRCTPILSYSTLASSMKVAVHHCCAQWAIIKFWVIKGSKTSTYLSEQRKYMKNILLTEFTIETN